MQYDPRQSRPAPSPIEPTGFFTGIQFRPIIGGVVLDTVSTIVLVTAYYSLFVARDFAAQGGAAEDAFAEYWNSSEGLMISLLLGSLGTVIGGFYAAYKAGTLEMKHGALVGIGSIILALVFQAMGSEREMPDWFMALSLIAAIPAGALGGFFAEMFKNVTGGGPRGNGQRRWADLLDRLRPMRSYKETLRFLIIREQLSLAWKLVFFVVCAALVYGSLAIRDMRVGSIDVRGTVMKNRGDLKEGAAVDYVMVRLENGNTIKASATHKIDYRPGGHVIVKETRTNFFGIKKHEFKKYVDEPPVSGSRRGA